AVRTLADQVSAEFCAYCIDRCVRTLQWDLMSVSIRKAKLTDIHELVPLAARTFPLACPPEMDRAAIEEFIKDGLNADMCSDRITGGDSYVLVATDGAMLLGYTVCINGELPDNAKLEMELPSDTTVMLSKFYVHPDCHGAGVSKKMMAHL